MLAGFAWHIALRAFWSTAAYWTNIQLMSFTWDLRWNAFMKSLISFLWQCAVQCRLESRVFVFVPLQCRQPDPGRDLEAHPPMNIHHILSRFVDGGCMEIWGYIFGFPWRGLMLPAEDICTINTFIRMSKRSCKYTLLHKDCFAGNPGLFKSCKQTSNPCKSLPIHSGSENELTFQQSHKFNNLTYRCPCLFLPLLIQDHWDDSDYFLRVTDCSI